MPKRKSVLVSVMFTLIFVTTMIVQSTHTALAVEECLSKPNAPAPQGQHWYYRIDHKNNRQCWRLGPEGLPVQRSETQAQKPKPQAAAQPEAPSRAQRPTTTGMGSTRAETSSDTNVDATKAMGWRDMPKFAGLPPSPLPVPQPPPVESTQTNSAIDAAPPERESVSASAGNPLPPESDYVEEPRRPAEARPAPMAPAQITAETDHKFALLIMLLVSLVIIGPIVHYVERQRRRAAIRLEPPRWAPVVASKMPALSVHNPLTPGSSVPVPSGPSDQSERLAQALQQLLDRLQTDLGLEQNTHSTRRPEIGMTKKRAR